jgi:hypothetical protein
LGEVEVGRFEVEVGRFEVGLGMCWTGFRFRFGSGLGWMRCRSTKEIGGHDGPEFGKRASESTRSCVKMLCMFLPRPFGTDRCTSSKSCDVSAVRSCVISGFGFVSAVRSCVISGFGFQVQGRAPWGPVPLGCWSLGLDGCSGSTLGGWGLGFRV